MADIDDIFRAASPVQQAAINLGLLQNLPGRWKGHGFNMIARPARQGVATNPLFFLEVNATEEILEFESLANDIPNRGDVEKTALLHGVRYVQSVTDCDDGGVIHVEPGLWLHVPPTSTNPTETYVRQANIPHGNSLIAQSIFISSGDKRPDIKPVNTFPFDITQPIPPLTDVTHPTLSGQYTDPFLNTTFSAKTASCLPTGLNAADVIKDPTTVLRAQANGQPFVTTDVVGISTAGMEGNGMLNIPFLVKNAHISQMDAIFWFETIEHPNAGDPGFDANRVFLQLQYVQRVILDFDNVHWPHISVATLIKGG
jgi:hypothetical protein